MVESTPPLMATPTLKGCMEEGRRAMEEKKRRKVRGGNSSAGGENRLQQRCQHLAIATDIHLFLPIFIGGTLAAGTAEKPTEMTCLKLPGRHSFFYRIS